jgi:hypothetical protein
MRCLVLPRGLHSGSIEPELVLLPRVEARPERVTPSASARAAWVPCVRAVCRNN